MWWTQSFPWVNFHERIIHETARSFIIHLLAWLRFTFAWSKSAFLSWDKTVSYLFNELALKPYYLLTWVWAISTTYYVFLTLEPIWGEED